MVVRDVAALGLPRLCDLHKLFFPRGTVFASITMNRCRGSARVRSPSELTVLSATLRYSSGPWSLRKLSLRKKGG